MRPRGGWGIEGKNIEICVEKRDQPEVVSQKLRKDIASITVATLRKNECIEKKNKKKREPNHKFRGQREKC